MPKVYDGTLTATVSCGLPALATSEGVTCTAGTATFDTATVGTGKTVTVSGLTLSGANAADYVLASPTATTTAAITAVTPKVSVR